MRIINRLVLGAVLVALCGFAGTAIADEPVVKVANEGSALIFYPVVEFREMILTVTGPCDYQYRQVVEKGTPFFKLNEETIDGAYTFGVSVMEHIDPEILEMLYKARMENDTELPKRLCRDNKLPGPPAFQTGGFIVVKGEIIYDPRSIEKGSVHEVAPADFDFGAQMSMVTSYMAAEGSGADATKVGNATKDFVINDDLIVDGSACIGFDCVNGESFGFDTIRLKEHNLRIKFDDTSTASSFPRNDWQLTANDSANGGASKFSIDDISGNRTPFTVEANARSHSLYVDDGGRIGSRTSTPSVEIHTIDGDTPTLRLQQDGSSGFAPQTWDVAGNETNFFVRDVTNGSTLPFRIRPEAPTSSIFIDTTGEVGFGTASPDSEIDVESSGPGFRLTNTGAGGGHWDVEVNATQGRLNFQYGDSNIPLKIDDGANTNLVQIGLNAADELTVNGNIVATGTITPDFVFEDDYDLLSIEEHAALMWSQKHLPAVAPAKPDGRGTHAVNLGQRSEGMLEELEKAHIYIEQLHKQAQEREESIGEAHARIAEATAVIDLLMAKVTELEERVQTH